MFSTKSKNLINKTQERALKVTYKDNTTIFETLLLESNKNSIHQSNLQFLMTEIYEVKNNYAPPTMYSLFHFR